MPDLPNEWTETQKAFFRMLTDQRVADIVQAADLIGGMSADGLSFLHKLSEPEQKALRRFFADAKPEMLTFLTEMRDLELEELVSAIDTGRSIRRAGKFARFLMISTFGLVVGLTVLWDKISAIIKAVLVSK